MQPETLIFTEIGQLIKGIHRTSVDGASIAHDAEWMSSRVPIGPHCLVQGPQVHFIAVIDRDDAWLSQPQQMRCVWSARRSLYPPPIQNRT